MWFRVLLTGVVCAAVPSMLAAQQNADAPEFPEFPVVAKAVSEHLAQTNDYKPGDILSVRDVQPLFAKIEKLGWKVADQQAIVQATLPDNDYLVAQLRTSEGRKMQRKIGLLPMAYDYLDRLRAMPRGTYRVRELIEGPDGYKMIEYMSTTKSGRNMTKQLTKAKDGKDFTQPTGRIYTEPLLLARLSASHEAEVERRDGKKSKAPSAKGGSAKTPSAKAPAVKALPKKAPPAKAPDKEERVGARSSTDSPF